MSGATFAMYATFACLCAALSAGCAAYARGMRAARARRRSAALEAQGAEVRKRAADADARTWVLRYAEALTRRLYAGTTEALAPSVRAKRAGKTRAGKRYAEQAVAAGCRKEISASAYCEARVRLAIAGLLAGALFGSVFSAELALVLGAAGFVGAGTLPAQAVQSLKRSRGICAQRHLSEMLEVVALGLRSGMTFDRSFALYGSHFDNDFARACAQAHRKWALGLVTREEALHELAASFDCPQLARVVDSMLRSLRFGSSVTGILEEAAAQARAAYRTALEERVAKAPVKMMLPTGTLILPAMLLLVMGPILLELAGGF